MKKIKKILLIMFLVTGIILVIPYSSDVYDDGGTREIVSLTYKIVNWHKIDSDCIYENTKIYFGNDRKKSIDELWELENIETEQTFIATILELNENSVLVEPVDNISISCDKISFGIQNLEKINVNVGDVVQITYTGEIMESYPAQIIATNWELSNDLRHLEYTEQWLDKNTAEQIYNYFSETLVITKIYSNCFFAVSAMPLPGEYKINCTLSDEWCVGDQVSCKFKNAYYDSKTQKREADLISIEVSDWKPDPNVCYKPVIYLYPETETEVSVNLTLDGDLTCTYPEYNNGWTVIASPDGTLTDSEGKIYNYLYWEGTTNVEYDFSEGFCVSGKDTAAFLEDALAKLGLNRREANEFIVYWLPLMEQNEYNIISFQSDIYTNAAQLKVDPAPDTLIRVFMAWQKSDEYIDIPEQSLTTPERNGFVVVEWGGTEITK